MPEIETSTDTIERICLEVGSALEAAERENWKDVLNGKVTAPQVTVVSDARGRIRTRTTGVGLGGHLNGRMLERDEDNIFVNAANDD